MAPSPIPGKIDKMPPKSGNLFLPRETVFHQRVLPSMPSRLLAGATEVVAKVLKTVRGKSWKFSLISPGSKVQVLYPNFKFKWLSWELTHGKLHCGVIRATF